MMADLSKRRGLLIILSSPSGAGKSTLAGRLRVWDPELSFSVSATTRAPRPSEVCGEHYHFTSEAVFKNQVATGDMLEHAHVFGNFYGSPKGPVQAAIDAAEGKPRPMVSVERFAFYDLAKQAYAVIQTGERRFYGCFMFRKGVIPPQE